MAVFDERKPFAIVPFERGRPLLDSTADLQHVLQSLVGRLDAVQRRAFHEKMAQLDRRAAYATAAGPSYARYPGCQS